MPSWEPANHDRNRPGGRPARQLARYRGGGHKRKFRRVDYKREKDGVPAVVKTGIEKVVALWCITAVKRVLLGLKQTVVVGIDGIGIDMQRTVSPTDAGAEIGLVGIVFLR